MIYIDLLLNLSLLVALSLVSGFIDRRWSHGQTRGALLQGLLFGGASVLGMLRPLVVAPGLIFDGRSVMISLCGLFFGPVAGGLAALSALVYRIWLGGIGLPMGILVISSSMIIGVWAHHRHQIGERLPSSRMLYYFGLVVHVAMVAMMFALPGDAKWVSLKNVAPSVIVFYPLATLLAGRVLGDQQRMTRDIDALRRAKDELRLFKESVESSSDAVGMSTPDGRHFYQNKAFDRLFGRVGEDPPATTYVDEQQGREVFATIMAGKSWTGEADMRDLHGEIRTILLKAYASKDEDGRITGLVGIHSDITQQKLDQLEWEKLQAQLLQAQKMESIGRLAGGVAHDFNNMLSVIIGHTDLALRKSNSDKVVHDHLQEISKAAHRSVELTRQLLAFARKQAVMPKLLNLNDTVQGMLRMLQRLIGENIELVWKPFASPLTVRLDPSQLDQILANLAVNARDAIVGSGRLEIETDRFWLGADQALAFPDMAEGEYVLLIMRDSGSGMDEEVAKHLFEPFFTTKGTGKGTGLGLATIFGIVTQNKGYIKISSELGLGTEVRIYLPLVQGEPSQTVSLDETDPIRGGSETILLVEDEPSILEMGQTMLTQLGYRVLCASGAKEAFLLVDEAHENIDLLVTDVIMPEINGKELSQLLMNQCPGLKVAFMSGYTADIIARHGVLDSGIHFLQKPFQIEELARLVREALDEA